MFSHLFGRGRHSEPIAVALYGMIVAQARAPAFYAVLDVPDTVRGRFEMVVLHTALVVDRLSTGGEAERTTGQRVFDLFCADMDQSLRELGVGDLAVPKRMKHVAESFYGRAATYGRSLSLGDAAGLAEAIGRNIFSEVGNLTAARALAAYAIAAAGRLAGVPAALLSEQPPFPDPAPFATAAAVS